MKLFRRKQKCEFRSIIMCISFPSARLDAPEDDGTSHIETSDAAAMEEEPVAGSSDITGDDLEPATSAVAGPSCL